MAFCQSCQDTFKFKFQAADVNKNGMLNLNELTALAGQAPFENKKPEDMFRIYVTLDKDRSAGISFDEWMHLYTIKFPPIPGSDECPRKSKHKQ